MSTITSKTRKATSRKPKDEAITPKPDAQDVALLPSGLAVHPDAPKPDTTGTTAERDARLAAQVKPYLRAIGAAVKDVRTIAATVRTGNEALAFARVSLGSAMLPVFQLLTADDGAWKWKDASAIEYLLAHYLKDEQDERGKAYNGTTVKAWLVAAEQEALLPAEQRDKFGSDVHRTLARVRKAKGDKAMLTFAAERIRKGETSIAKARKAYDAKYPASAKPEPDAAAVAATITAEFAATAGPARATFKRTGISPSTVYSALYLACTIGQRFPDADPEATSMAIRTLMNEPKAKATGSRKAK